MKGGNRNFGETRTTDDIIGRILRIELVKIVPSWRNFVHRTKDRIARCKDHPATNIILPIEGADFNGWHLNNEELITIIASRRVWYGEKTIILP